MPGLWWVWLIGDALPYSLIPQPWNTPAAETRMTLSAGIFRGGSWIFGRSNFSDWAATATIASAESSERDLKVFLGFIDSSLKRRALWVWCSIAVPAATL